MLLSQNESNVYKLDDILPDLTLIITDQYVEFMREGDNGFYFAYFSLQKFIDRIDGSIFSDKEHDESDIISIDLDYYADLFKGML